MFDWIRERVYMIAAIFMLSTAIAFSLYGELLAASVWFIGSAFLFGAEWNVRHPK